MVLLLYTKQIGLFMKNDGYLIYDFERGQFWNQNKYGYTENIKEAGRFDYESSYSIVKDANKSFIEAEMVHSTDIKRLFEIQSEIGVKEKLDINDVLKKYTSGNVYFKNNPMGDLINDLSNAGHYFKETNIPHVNYETTEKVDLDPEVGNIGIQVKLYRMPSGSYEVIANKIDLSIPNKAEVYIDNEKKSNTNKLKK